jgi:cation/acetate symporter
MLILGFGIVAFVGWDTLMAVDASGNLAAPLLASEVGGDFLVAFISAVAFATILAVVTGLVIAATSSVAHDIFHHILCNGKATEQQQLYVAKLTAAAIGLISILLSLNLKNINVTFLVSLTFVVAASTNLPLLLFTLYWRRFNITGAITGVMTGLIVSLLLVLLGPNLMFINDHSTIRGAIFSLYNPGIIAIPCGFLGAVIGTLISREPFNQELFEKTIVQSQTGIR